MSDQFDAIALSCRLFSYTNFITEILGLFLTLVFTKPYKTKNLFLSKRLKIKIKVLS